MLVHHIITYIYDRKFLYQFITTVVIYFIIRFIHFIQRRRERFTIFEQFGIPGPKPSLLDGHYREYVIKHYRGERRQLFKTDMKYHEKYGKVYGTFMGEQGNLTVTDLDLLKKIFIDDENKVFNERFTLFLEIPMAKSILFAKYPRWKVIRKALNPFFSQYTVRGTAATQFIEDSLKLMLDYIDQKFVEANANKNTKAIIDIHGLMKTTTLHLINEMAIKLPDVRIGESDPYVESLDNQLETADHGLIALAVMFPPITPILNFLSTHFEYRSRLALIFRSLNRVIDKDLNELKNKHTIDGQQEQAINLMIKLHHKGVITREELVANAEALLFAGYDTTSTTLTYLFWLLAKHPEIQEKLHSDIMAHGIESTYLVQVIKESMRIYPVISSFITRMTSKTVQINGWTIPEGTKIIYNNHLMNRNPEIWPEPEKFDPERFRKGAVIHPCAFAPFGLGQKKCLGYSLSWLELKMITCNLMMRYRVRLVSPFQLDYVSACGFLTTPSEKVILEFERLY